MPAKTLPGPRFNIADHFITPNLAPGRRERVYLHCGGDTLTFGALHGRAGRFAAALRRMGVAPGERVALLMRESLDFPVCFWGAVLAGAVPVPLNTVLHAADYAFFLENAGARVLVVDPGLWPVAAGAVASLGGPLDVVLSAPADPGGMAGAASVPGFPVLEDVLAVETAAEAGVEAFPAAPEDPAFWLYTSGSTGRPKPVVHRQADMAHVAEHYLGHVPCLVPEDLGYSAPKMFFAYGMGNSLYFPLASGSSAVIDPAPATAASAFANLARYRPTVFYAVPSLFNAMLNLHEDWREGRTPLPAAFAGRLPRLEHLRLALSGGEVLPDNVFHRWRGQFALPILDGLGSTEALHFYLSNTPGTPEAPGYRAGSAGRVVPGYQVRLVDERGAAVPDGAAGELLLRGGSLPGGADAWLATGDRLRRDRDGFFFHEGRVDDMLKVGGSWVSPLEVERVLGGHPAVAECAVTGEKTRDGLTRIVAHVVLRTGEPDGEGFREGLLAHARRRLPPFKLPAEVRILPALPRTASGKPRRFLLRQMPPNDPSILDPATAHQA